MVDAALVHGLEFLAPPREQAQAFGGVADLVAEVVGPAAKRVDIVEILVQAFGQQKSYDVEVLVMMGGEPARVSLGGRSGVSTLERLRGVNVLFGGEQR